MAGPRGPAIVSNQLDATVQYSDLASAPTAQIWLCSESYLSKLLALKCTLVTDGDAVVYAGQACPICAGQAFSCPSYAFIVAFEHPFRTALEVFSYTEEFIFASGPHNSYQLHKVYSSRR